MVQRAVVGYVTLDKLGEGDYSVHISERRVSEQDLNIKMAIILQTIMLPRM